MLYFQRNKDVKENKNNVWKQMNFNFKTQGWSTKDTGPFKFSPGVNLIEGNKENSNKSLTCQ